MQVLRFILAVASAGSALYVFYGLMFFAHLKPSEQTLAVGAAALFVLNIFYLLACPPGAKPAKSRIGKLLSLWLDAKERELKDRSQPKNSN